MKKSLVIMLALVFGLCAVSTFAHAKNFSFVCKEVADNARDNEIKLSLSAQSATMVNFMNDGRNDEGKLKSAKVNGDYIYKGFPHYVENGVPESGYLYVPYRLLKTGSGTASLHSRHCEKDACSMRTTNLSCNKH